jgi:hypothetical protein
VCVWLDTETEPVLRVPVSGPNAFQLGKVLTRELSVRLGLPAHLPGNPLGRLLFTRPNPDAGKEWLLWGFAVAASLSVIPLMIRGVPFWGVLNADADEVATRTRLAMVIARRWWADLPHRPVRWTSRLRFMPGGIEFLSGGLLEGDEVATVPYQATSYFLHTEHLTLFAQGVPKPLVQQPLSEANFWPGLQVLDWMYARLREQHEEQQRAREDARRHAPSGGADDPERQITPGLV